MTKFSGKYINSLTRHNIPHKVSLSQAEYCLFSCAPVKISQNSAAWIKLCSFQISPLCRIRSKGPFHRIAASNQLSCLTSLLQNFPLIEPKSERRVARQWLPDDFQRDTMRRQQRRCVKSPLEMSGPRALLWPTGL